MLRIKEQPTEPIIRDAWTIAHAVAYKADQEKFLIRATRPYKIKMHAENIRRIRGLIEERIAAWDANYGPDKAWYQYIDDCPRQDYVESLLAGVK
jgi:hypothetical protein